MSMKRTTVDGKTLNQRTADMLALWQFNALQDFYVVQGSYNAGGVKASAGTHDGGGALDISVYGMDLKEKKWVVKQGRLAGFMAYYRPTLPGVWNEHIHAGALGDPEASAGLRAQFADYRAGRNALADDGPDRDPRVPIKVYPHVTHKKISGLVAYRQFKTKKPRPRMTVKRIQWVLNEKLGARLVCDGVAGPQTRAAFKQWEKHVKAPAADGVPGKFSLSKLGEGRFTVGWLSWEKWRKTQVNHKSRAEAKERSKPTFHNN